MALEKIHLTIIREVERQGSLTAAARVLCLTQSALSHTIKKLEQRVGTAIWLREGRHLRLTQAGHYLLGVANRLLPQLEHAEERVRQYASGERGTLRNGIECHPCYRWLLRVVSPYLTNWPDVDVDDPIAWWRSLAAAVAQAGEREIAAIYKDVLKQPELAFGALTQAFRDAPEHGDLQVRILTDRQYLAPWLSYRLGLDGPSITVEAACATSLTAVHVAVQALIAGECDAALAGGVAVVKVGAATETEMKEKKHRVEDALQATRAALEEGIVPGGGVALLNAADKVKDAAEKLEGDEKTGALIILRSLEGPLRQRAPASPPHPIRRSAAIRIC